MERKREEKREPKFEELKTKKERMDRVNKFKDKVLEKYKELINYAERLTLEKRAERSRRDIEDVLLKLLLENIPDTTEATYKVHLYEITNWLRDELGDTVIKSPLKARGALKRLGIISKEGKDSDGRFYYINIKRLKDKAERRGIKTSIEKPLESEKEVSFSSI